MKYMKSQGTASLTPRQSRAAELLAAGRSGVGVAKELGIGERTLRTWLADPGFRGEVARLRAAALDEALSKLSAASSAAAETLTLLLMDDESAIRLRAATAILDMHLKVREQTELAARIADLEALSPTSGGRGRVA